MDKTTTEQLEFSGNNKEYKVGDIYKSAFYIKNLEADYKLGLYYPVSWKNYPKVKNTEESALAVLHHQKLVSTFYKNYSNKPTATFLFIDLALLIAKHIAWLNVNGKQKSDQLIINI